MKFVDQLIAGVSVGMIYALVALGFVIIYKATGVINFAHGAMMAMGAYLAFDLRDGFALPWWVALSLGALLAMLPAKYLAGKLPERWGRGGVLAVWVPAWVGMAVWLHAEAELGFWLRLVLAAILTAYVGIGFEWLVLRRMIGHSALAVVMATLGLEIVLRVLIELRYGPNLFSLDAPFSGDAELFGYDVYVGRIWAVALTLGALVGCYVFFRWSRMGLAMRATAVDLEAARVVGVSVRTVFALSWAIAAALATLAGVLLVTSVPGSALTPAVVTIGLRAFPAVIVGGLDSMGGAILGGLLLGVVEMMVAGYQPSAAPFLGEGFHQVAAYLVMILVLLVRPQGLFGSPEIKRV